MELNKKNTYKILGIMNFGIVLYCILQNFQTVKNVISIVLTIVSPFLIGFCIAIILNVPMSFIEKKLFNNKKMKKINKMKRPLSIVISISILILFLAFVLFLVVPELINTFAIFKENIPTFLDNIKQWVSNIFKDYPDVINNIQSINLDWNNINKTLVQFAQGGISAILESSVNIVTSIITFFVNLVIGIIFAIYILLQKEGLKLQMKRLLYAYLKNEKVEKILNVFRISNRIFKNFITGQFTEAIILGTLCFIGMLIFRFPYALTISVLIAFTALIPLVGAFIGTAVGVILIVVTSPIKAVLFVLFIIVLQQIEGNIIYPKVVGDSVGLPPIWVLVAMTVGGSTIGLLGIVISVPIASVIYTVLKENVADRLISKEIKIE